MPTGGELIYMFLLQAQRVYSRLTGKTKYIWQKVTLFRGLYLRDGASDFHAVFAGA